MTDSHPRPGEHRPRALPRLLAPLGGVLLTLSLAPYALWPAGMLGCALLAALLQGVTPREAALRGGLFGLGLFGSGASWVYVSIHLYGGAGIGLAGLLTAIFCAGLALLPAGFGFLQARWLGGLRAGAWLGFPALWVLFEWLRSWLLTGFPWLYLGYAHLDTWLAGWAPLIGVYGLSLLAALSATTLLVLAEDLMRKQARAPHLLGGAALLALIWLGGWALRAVDWVSPQDTSPLRVALYQPNIPQERKWDREYLPEILGRYRNALPQALPSDLILWPEAAIPALYSAARPLIDPMARQATAADAALLTGIPMRGDSGALHNSIIALGNGQGVYHKQRLVPFGEYVPLEQWLRGLIDFFDLPMSSFSPGPSAQPPLVARGHRVAPFICYEIVYPDLVAAAAREAELLVTVSNDTWFGASAGPLQHLQMARMRALENGRYLLRGTNNGVSAVIDERGRLLQQSAQFEETLLRGEAKLMQGSTPFSRLGSLPVLLLCTALLAGLRLAARRDSSA